MRKLVIVGCVAVLATLTACSNVPKPPTVSGTDRTSINDEGTISLLAFQADLAQTKERVRKLERQSGSGATLTATRAASQTVTFHFAPDSAELRPSPKEEAALKPLLATARRIQIRGRTDAEHPSARDESLAFDRAHAALNYLVALGVPTTKVSINYLSGGDPVGNPDSTFGRAANRRVEIEVFQ